MRRRRAEGSPCTRSWNLRRTLVRCNGSKCPMRKGCVCVEPRAAIVKRRLWGRRVPGCKLWAEHGACDLARLFGARKRSGVGGVVCGNGVPVCERAAGGAARVRAVRGLMAPGGGQDRRCRLRERRAGVRARSWWRCSGARGARLDGARRRPEAAGPLRVAEVTARDHGLVTTCGRACRRGTQAGLGVGARGWSRSDGHAREARPMRVSASASGEWARLARNGGCPRRRTARGQPTRRSVMARKRKFQKARN